MKAKIIKTQISIDNKLITIESNLIKPNRYQNIYKVRRKIKNRYDCEKVYFNYICR